MSFSGIALYCLRAGSFAAAICILYGAACLLRRKKPGYRRLLGLAYLAALVQITVLRGGVNWQDVLHAARPAPQLVPLKTTFELLSGGLWSFIYNTVGNLIWFVPLGLLLGRGRALRALLLGAALSAAIELSQYLLMTGLTDIDDVIINALGSLLGWGMYRLHPKRRIPTYE